MLFIVVIFVVTVNVGRAGAASLDVIQVHGPLTWCINIIFYSEYFSNLPEGVICQPEP